MDLLELYRDGPRVVAVLSALLERAVSRKNNNINESNNNHPKQQQSKTTVFHGLRAPSISIHNYLQRIFKYANCSPACFVVAYAYIDRFIHQQPDVSISPLNVHRLLITSVMLAAKFLDDAYYNNAYYAKVGGVTTAEMNRLELQFLFRLDFRLQVTVSVFESYCTHLEREATSCCGSHQIIQRPLMLQPASHTCCGLDHTSAANSVHHQPIVDKQQLSLRCSYAGL